ncbi:inhibitor of apoptosis protein-like isoform X2 [Rhinoderma darwinii]|uniref:inhibitor of apoptosis protein-like isoform X2 n=1 Tax=Rhinoderma darwinii TaxID=43563 RepID=UPI003F67C0E0
MDCLGKEVQGTLPRNLSHSSLNSMKHSSRLRASQTARKMRGGAFTCETRQLLTVCLFTRKCLSLCEHTLRVWRNGFSISMADKLTPFSCFLLGFLFMRLTMCVTVSQRDFPDLFFPSTNKMQDLNSSPFLANLLKSTSSKNVITMELSCELYRFSTFSKFPVNIPVSERSLAKAGFYYIGTDDKVKCFNCGLMLDNWKKGDNAIEKHKMLYPSCSFIQNVSSLNLGASMYSAFSAPTLSNPTHSASCEEETGYIMASFQSIPNDLVSSRAVEDLSHQRGTDSNSSMYTEEARLGTYANWPLTFLTPTELSKAGFYYLGPGDKVACFACDGKLNNWEPKDNAMSEHRRHFPSCPFVSNVVRPSLRCSVSNVSMQTTSSRLKTFVNWPARIPVTPKKLSEAGFYYVGRNDDVKCFCCDGGLRCWESGDDPWVEHAKWFPRCEYLLHVKGQSFVTDIQDRYPHLLDQLLSSSETQNHEAQYPPIIRLGNENNQDDDLYMNTALVQNVLQMGFNRRLVKETVMSKMLTSGENYKETEDLVNDLLCAQKEQTEEERDRQMEQSSSDEITLIRKSRLTLSQRMTNCLPIIEDLFTSEVLSSTEYDALKQKMPVALQAQELIETVLIKGLNAIEEFKNSLNKHDPGLHRELLHLPMEEQLRRLQEERTCKICMDQEVSIVFIPCGHLVVCKDCAPSLRKCPICRGIIKGTVRTFLS